MSKFRNKRGLLLIAIGSALTTTSSCTSRISGARLQSDPSSNHETMVKFNPGKHKVDFSDFNTFAYEWGVKLTWDGQCARVGTTSPKGQDAIRLSKAIYKIVQTNYGPTPEFQGCDDETAVLFLADEPSGALTKYWNDILSRPVVDTIPPTGPVFGGDDPKTVKLSPVRLIHENDGSVGPEIGAVYSDSKGISFYFCDRKEFMDDATCGKIVQTFGGTYFNPYVSSEMAAKVSESATKAYDALTSAYSASRNGSSDVDTLLFCTEQNTGKLLLSGEVGYGNAQILIDGTLSERLECDGKSASCPKVEYHSVSEGTYKFEYNGQKKVTLELKKHFRRSNPRGPRRRPLERFMEAFLTIGEQRSQVDCWVERSGLE